MNLAEVTALLRSKDGEKTVTLSEIRNTEALKSRGFIGRLEVSLVTVENKTQSSGTLKYTLSPPDYGEACAADQDRGSVGGHLLISKDVLLQICLEIPESSEVIEEEEGSVGLENTVAAVPVISYYAEFDCKELPEEGYMQLELIGKNEGQLHDDVKFVIKVMYDEFEQLIAHKMMELEQLQQQMKDLSSSLKETKGGKPVSLSSKGNKMKKMKKKAAAVDDEPLYDVDEKEEESGPSIFETTVSVGYGVLAFAIPNRAYILFGIAAAGIHYYGEYASI